MVGYFSVPLNFSLKSLNCRTGKRKEKKKGTIQYLDGGLMGYDERTMCLNALTITYWSPRKAKGRKVYNMIRAAPPVILGGCD